MALIKCPECDKDLSDKAEVCIHCGYPIKEESTNKKCEILGTVYDFTEEFKIAFSNNPTPAIGNVSRKTNMTPGDSGDLIDIVLEKGEFPPSFTPEFPLRESNAATPKINLPKCPTCSSTNVNKISAGQKIVGGAMFGLFSSNVRKTMHCNDCGYKW